MTENISKAHLLVVGEFVPGEPGDCFEVEHLDDCPTETHDAGPFDSYISYTCLVGYFLDSEGLDTCFRHADDPSKDDGRTVLTPGQHLIEAWSAYDPPHPGGGGEWDGGLRLAEGPPETTDLPDDEGESTYVQFGQPWHDEMVNKGGV